MARRLDAAGLRSVDDIARASIERLMEVPGVGQHVAIQLQAQARELAAGSSVNHDESRAEVARSVKRLRAAIPDLARSKKQASRLKKSTKRMAGWVGDLDQGPVRKQFMAEVTRISEGARKGTASKKDAKTLRKHANRIENAVRKVG
jgi:hypothetical protein